MTRTGMTVADIVDAAARGRIGHHEAMARLGLESYLDLLETMRANGRSLWAHSRSSAKPQEDMLEILRLACLGPARTVDGPICDEPEA